MATTNTIKFSELKDGRFHTVQDALMLHPKWDALVDAARTAYQALELLPGSTHEARYVAAAAFMSPMVDAIIPGLDDIPEDWSDRSMKLDAFRDDLVSYFAHHHNGFLVVDRAGLNS